MKLSLKYRIAIMILLLETIMMGLVLWQTLEHSLDASRTQLEATEQTILNLVGNVSRVALLTEEYAELQPYLENLQKDPRVLKVMLADAQQRVVASTHSDDIGRTFNTALTHHNNDTEHFWRQLEISNSNGKLGELAINFSNKALLQAYTKARNLGLTIAAFGMLIIAIAGITTGFLLTRRLERITAAAQRFAKGENLVKTGVQGNDELGELAHSFDSMAKSITKKQQLLQESEHYNRTLFEQSAIGLALCRMNGELVDINSAYARIIGRDVEETLQLSYWDITPKSYIRKEEHQLNCLDATGCYGPYEKEYIHKDGHLVPVRLQGQLLEKDGETFIWSSVEDITSYKQAEEALHESQKMLQLVLDTIPVRVFWKDRNSVYLGCNKHFARDAGLEDAEQIIGKTDFQLSWHEQAELYRADDQQVMQSGEAKLNYEEPQSSATGNIWLQTSKIPLLDRHKKVFGVLGIYEDITKRKQTEEALRRSQKMEAIGQLSGGVAHDFNNQLGVIIGYLDFLQEYTRKDEIPHKWVNTASHATMRCMDLTQQLLTFSRQQNKEKTVANLNITVREQETIIKRTVTPEVEVEYFLADTLWLTKIDTGEFHDAILNLVINARDAMPNGGKLLIETSNKHLSADYAALNYDATPGDYVQLTLSDTGCGMDSETLEHVFEPFFTTKSEGKGTGLGLAMVYGFVKRNGGHIKIYSELGIGTTVHLYLPRSTSSELPAMARTNDKTELPTGSENILIVDDEVNLLQLADQYLTDLGYHTHTAKNAPQALKILAENNNIDLLFSDVVMPDGMSGYELAQQATQQKPALKILLTSGFTSKTIAHNGLARFSSHLLNKPYRKAELAQHVRMILDEEDNT